MSTGSTEVYRPDALEIVETGDGSRTLFDPDRDVHYSSLHGAHDESRHIFIDGTKLTHRDSPWHVLELGFGAGINFVQTAAALDEQLPAGSLVYHAVDYAPVAADRVDFHDGRAGELVSRVLESVDVDCPSRVSASSSDGALTLHLHPLPWSQLELSEGFADAVFYDPFGPKSEPDSWTPHCFEVARRHMGGSALLGTYSAATRVKRAMFRADLHVASAPGPGPKREITFASRDPDQLRDYELLDPSDYLDHPDA